MQLIHSRCHGEEKGGGRIRTSVLRTPYGGFLALANDASYGSAWTTKAPKIHRMAGHPFVKS